MAITKFTRTSANEEQFRDDLITVLTPYFNTVTYVYDEVNNKNQIECTVTVEEEEKNFFTVDLGRKPSFALSRTYYLDGSNSLISTSYIPNTNAAGLNEVYKCSNGLMLGINYSSTQYQPILGVTRDNNENTVIITPATNFSTGNGVTPNDKPISEFQAINANSIYGMKNLVFSQNCIYPHTVITNIPVNEAGAYCPNAFKFECKEDNISSYKIRKITLDGVDYLTNGFWCIKDGG